MGKSFARGTKNRGGRGHKKGPPAQGHKKFPSKKKKFQKLKGGKDNDKKPSQEKEFKTRSLVEEEPCDGRLQGIEDLNVDEFIKGDFLKGDDVWDDINMEEEEDDEEEEENGEDELLDIEKEEDEDEEDAEDNSSLDGKTRHKQDLENLKEMDPEFYKFLQENDKELLAFAGDELEEKEEDEDDDCEGNEKEKFRGEEEGDVEMAEEGTCGTSGKATELTIELLSQLEKGVLQHKSIKFLRKLISAFRSACHMDSGKQKQSALQDYTVNNSKVFDSLMVTCLNELPGVFEHQLFPEDADVCAPQTYTRLGSHPKWKQMKPLIYRFFKSLHHLLTQVTEPDLLNFLLLKLDGFIPWMVPFPKLGRSFLRPLLILWGTSEVINVKVGAFLRIRKMSCMLPFPFIEDCLKGLYLAYVRNAKFVSEQTLPRIVFMGNCLVELYGIDRASSYQHAYVYIRQLALHLRAAYTHKTKEKFQKIYNWQYYNCLRAWTAVICAYPEDLKDLVYPLIQIMLGLLKLIPSARYFPLRFHCVNLMQKLAAASQQFVPCASLLLEVLEEHIFQKKPKGSTAVPPHLDILIKLGKDFLEFRAVQEAVVMEALELLHHEVALYQYSIAFPEYMSPVLERLRKFNKEVTASKWKASVRGLVESIVNKSEYVINEREKLDGRLVAMKNSLEILKPKIELSMTDRLSKLIAMKSGPSQGKVESKEIVL